MKPDPNPSDAIASYQSAYVLARGLPAPVITYSEGWYTFEGHNGLKYRSLDPLRKQLVTVAKERGVVSEA